MPKRDQVLARMRREVRATADDAHVFESFTFQRGDVVKLILDDSLARWLVTHLELTLGEAGAFRTYRIKGAGRYESCVLEMELELVEARQRTGARNAG